MGEALRGPTDVAFAGPHRDIMLAASLDNLCLHRMDDTGVVGLAPQLPDASVKSSGSYRGAAYGISHSNPYVAHAR